MNLKPHQLAAHVADFNTCWRPQPLAQRVVILEGAVELALRMCAEWREKTRIEGQERIALLRSQFAEVQREHLALSAPDQRVSDKLATIAALLQSAQ